MKRDELALAPRSEGELFKRVLGARWQELHPDIRARFDQNPAPGRPLYYLGALSELRASRFGKGLGWLSMPFARGALLPYDDTNVAMSIRVYCAAGDPHIYKERTYYLNGRNPVLFTSRMRQSPGGEVLEYVGGGLGMKLQLEPREGNLHFRSDGYFVELFGWRVPIPAWAGPGHTALAHCNDGPGAFNIRIQLTHPWWGPSFLQVGAFREANAAEAQPRTLFQLAMGPSFERLHPALRRFHSLAGRRTLSGRVNTEPPATRLGRMLGWFTRTPASAQEGEIRFELDAMPLRERWTRRFPRSTMASTLSLRGSEVIERLGAATLVFELREAGGGLSMNLKRMRFLGIPCPRWLMPRIRAEERGEGESLHFDIQADVPGCGTVVHYRGWLALPPA